jgi:hypothetical protein
MNTEKVAQEFDATLAEAYIQRALREGRSEDEGLEDYLEKELGFWRSEKIDEFLRQIEERGRQSTEKFLNNLINTSVLAATTVPSWLPMVFKAAGSDLDALIDKIESSTDPKLKPVQKWLKTHKEDLLAELQY